MAVSQWFREWFRRHCDRNLNFVVPDGAQLLELIDLWKVGLTQIGCTYEIAMKGTDWIAGEENANFDHWPRLRVKILELLKEEYGDKPSIVADRAAAERDSKSCPDCNGSGLAIRYRHNALREGRGSDALGARIAFYCLCDYGRWLRDAQRTSAPDVFARRNDLADHPKLHLIAVAVGEWDHPNRYPPTVVQPPTQPPPLNITDEPV
jgi:hypothetical protein